MLRIKARGFVYHPYHANNRLSQSSISPITLQNVFNDSGNLVALTDELGYGAFSKYTTTGPPNKPEAVSRLQRSVVSLIRCLREVSGSTRQTEQERLLPIQ